MEADITTITTADLPVVPEAQEARVPAASAAARDHQVLAALEVVNEAAASVAAASEEAAEVALAVVASEEAVVAAVSAAVASEEAAAAVALAAAGNSKGAVNRESWDSLFFKNNSEPI